MFGSGTTISWIFCVVPKWIGMFHMFPVSAFSLFALAFVNYFYWSFTNSKLFWVTILRLEYLIFIFRTCISISSPSLIRGQQQPTHYQQNLTIWLCGRWVENMNKISVILFFFERQREKHPSSVDNWDVWYVSTPWLGLQNRIYFSIILK